MIPHHFTRWGYYAKQKNKNNLKNLSVSNYVVINRGKHSGFRVSERIKKTKSDPCCRLQVEEVCVWGRRSGGVSVCDCIFSLIAQ